ncbi:TetR/AcrR family transcriptional regulator [Pendulispora rubella]|uniref:TetR/AcrR family transcriptional regulator n=1 Tax=Pendulispora rubella TaxID=2741070 RepID=A0ABZ2KUS9_9BACT
MPRRSKTQTAERIEAEDDVRARVLEAAVQLIDEGGLASLSMREVARRAGVSHQAPYHYFPDRESILAAVAEEGFILLDREIESVADAGERPVDRLVSAGEAYVRFAHQHPAHFRVMFRRDFVDIDRFPHIKECGQKAFDRLLEIVHACVADGLPAHPSEQALIVFGWSVVHGLACLLLDGCIGMKMPEMMPQVASSGLAPGSKTIVSDVMETLRAMTVAASEPKPKSKRTKA